jgi:hypothetical protein
VIKTSVSTFALSAFFLISAFTLAFGQSRDVNFPTPVRSNEITGLIAARDIGDSRATSYFYTFEGGQGDLFINLVTRNFAGDVDVFIADGLRPMTKMVVFANPDESETGRLIYLRKPEKLILRVEGRTPNDDPATYRIKFGGSFIASSEKGADEGIPTVAGTDPNQPGVKVNSVGTIIAVIPKPVAAKPEPVAKNVEPPAKKVERPAKRAEPEPKAEARTKAAEAQPKKPAVVVTERANPLATAKAAKNAPPKKPAATNKPAPPKKAAAKAAKPAPPPRTPPEPAPDPLANVRLVVELKDGTTVWLPMPEVQRFGFDKGVLTIVAKDGSVTRYPIVDVAKVTMQ